MVRREIRFNSNVEEKVREETFQDRTYLVAPVVAIVEGVLTPGNVGKPELALMSEFKKSLDAWNGRPVVLNHPASGNDRVSANSPAMYDEYACGLIFNSTIDGKKLKQEIWIDLDRAKLKGGEFQEAVDKIQNGEMIDVSTGFFCDAVAVKGRFNGSEYEAVWRNINPDHLALLPNMPGACSIADGCGIPRINESSEGSEIIILELPSPNSGEDHDKFHSRCMGNSTAVKEFPDEKQRNAVCYSQWNKKHGTTTNDTDRVIDAVYAQHIANGRLDLAILANQGIANEGTANGIKMPIKNVKCSCLNELTCTCNKPTSNSMEVRANILSKARRPSFSGTETTSWGSVDKSIGAYLDSYNSHNSGKEDSTDVTKMSGGAKRWIASKSLLGDPSADNSRDLLFFPVVNPKTNKLNENALHAVIGGRGAQAKEDKTAVESAQSMAKSLLKSEFNIDSEKDAKTNEAKLKESLSILSVKLIANTSGISDSDLRYALEAAMEDEGCLYCYIVAVYADSFVYTDWMSNDMMEVPYTSDEMGNVTIDMEKMVEVRPMTSFISIDDTENDIIMNRGKVMANETKVEVVPVVAAAAVMQPVALKDNAALTMDQLIENTPAHLKPTILAGIKMHKDHVDGMVAKIIANKRNTFTDAELRAMEASSIEKLFKLAGEEVVVPDPAKAGSANGSPQSTATTQAHNYALQPAGQRVNAAGDKEDDDTIPAPRSLSEIIRENAKLRANGNQRIQ